MTWLPGIVFALGCACSSKQAGPTTGSGSGGGGSSASCEGVRDQVAGLYRAEAAARPGKHVGPTYVEDNTAMVLADCAREPGRVIACVSSAATVPAVEQCLTPLDDEGSEGDLLAR